MPVVIYAANLYPIERCGSSRLLGEEACMDEFLEQARPAVLLALEEDIGGGDVTTLATIPAETQARGNFLAKSSGIVAGLEVAALTYGLIGDRRPAHDPGGSRRLDGEGVTAPAVSKEGACQLVQFSPCVEEGTWVAAGTVVASAAGPAHILLTAERVALNFVQRMSGIATLTRRYVEAAQGTGAVILDTRKTAPGLRLFDKRAVALGGGKNHRFGLFDMALIKDNHIAAAGGIAPAGARHTGPVRRSGYRSRGRRSDAVGRGSHARRGPHSARQHDNGTDRRGSYRYRGPHLS